MSGALQHIDHLHVDWTRFCFESLSCIQNLFKKKDLVKLVQILIPTPSQGRLDEHPLGERSLQSNGNPQHLGQRSRPCAHNWGDFYFLNIARKAKVSNILLSKFSPSQIVYLEDESYLYYQGSLPNCIEEGNHSSVKEGCQCHHYLLIYWTQHDALIEMISWWKKSAWTVVLHSSQMISSSCSTIYKRSLSVISIQEALIQEPAE